MKKPTLLKHYMKYIGRTHSSVTVTLIDGTKGKISRIDEHTPLLYFSFPSKALLESYLDSRKGGIVRLDNGKRIPLCNIREISPIKTVTQKVLLDVKVYRDWSGFPFDLTRSESKELEVCEYS